MNVHRLGWITFTCILIAQMGFAQQTTERETHIKNRNLGSYYAERIVDSWRTMPWLHYPQQYKSNLTERIDKVHAPGHIIWIDTAWGVMEIKTGMIPEKRIKPLVGAMIDFWDNPEDGYNDFGGLQQYIAKKEGDEVAGFLVMARTRPPMRQQMGVRHDLMKMICLLHDFQQILLETADRTKDAVMPGYTHIRHAQPTTMGHYLMSIYDPINRSMKMLEDGYHAMSLNELGCGALAGTSWPIDRELVSEYLGLEGLIENTNDAVSYSDGYVLVMSGLTNIMAILSRMGLEMEFWSTLEYNFFEFEIGATSYMMPNKRSNQTYLENLNVAAAKMIARQNEVSTMGIRIPHGDMQPMAYNMKEPVVSALQLIEKHVEPLLYHFPTMHLHRDKMLALAREGYSCSTELANEIVRRFEIDYLTAHEIVNVFVKASAAKDIPAYEAKLDMLQDAAKEVVGRELDFTQKELRTILDPEHFVKVTNSRGAVSPEQVSRMINDRWPELDAARQRHLERIQTLEKAKQKLLSDLHEIYRKY